jgi:hypothetical protein
MPLRPQAVSWRLCGSSGHEALSAASSFITLEERRFFLTLTGHTLRLWNMQVSGWGACVLGAGGGGGSCWRAAPALVLRGPCASAAGL